MPSKSAAIAAWNRRVTPQPEAQQPSDGLVKELERLITERGASIAYRGEQHDAVAYASHSERYRQRSLDLAQFVSANSPAILAALKARTSPETVELLRQARDDTHLIAMLDPARNADARLNGERIREAADRLARIDAHLSNTPGKESSDG
jgi:hypothetical protein